MIELGSGTGWHRASHRAVRRPHRPRPVDAMLRHQPDLALKVQADASMLPFPDGAADLPRPGQHVALPAEVDRVVRPGGGLLWINTLGHETLIYLSPAAVVDALPALDRTAGRRFGSLGGGAAGVSDIPGRRRSSTPTPFARE